MQSLDTDIQSLGGSGMGGFGGGSMNNPLLWLITLGFLSNRGGLLGGGNEGGAGVIAGENSAKLDCLAQQHSALSSQIESNSIDNRFAGLSSQLTDLSGISRDQAASNAIAARDIQDTFLRETAAQARADDARNFALSSKLDECCCDLKAGQQAIKTDIAMQTTLLLTAIKDGNREILDAQCQTQIRDLETEAATLRQRLQTAEIAAACSRGVVSSGPGNSGNVPAV